MDNKICTRCSIEKSTEDFYSNYTECKICNSNRSLRRYYEKKMEYQIKIKYIIKKIEKNIYKNKIIDI